jgi:uncharacterized membrane protein YedE/YeeE
MNALLGLLLGALAACGFVLAGVVEPGVILHAFTYDQSWDARLWLFFTGAFAVSLPLTALVRKRGVTRGGAPLAVVAPRAVDARLVLGSLVFGVGWGLSGACPGPAVAALGSGTLRAVTFVGALVLGLALGHLALRQRTPSAAQPPACTKADALDASTGKCAEKRSFAGTS